MVRLVTTLCATLSGVLMLTLAGCGKSPESPAQPAASSPPESARTESPSANTVQARDLCSVVTDEEFQQATGFPVLSKKSFPGDPSGAGCDWQLKTTGAMSGVHRISIDIKTPGGRERFKFMASGSLKKIPELGEGAVQTGGNMDGSVWAVTGDTLVTLRYGLPVTTADPNPVVVPLLKTILPRL